MCEDEHICSQGSDSFQSQSTASLIFSERYRIQKIPAVSIWYLTAHTCISVSVFLLSIQFAQQTDRERMHSQAYNGMITLHGTRMPKIVFRMLC